MTKSKKSEKRGAVNKIARKTVDLMLRVGDKLEAAAASAAASAQAAAAPVPPVAVPVVVAPLVAAPVVAAPVVAVQAAISALDAPSRANVAAPLAPALQAPAPVVPALALPAIVRPPPALASEPLPSAAATALRAFELHARADADIDAYAKAHNLRSVDMPARSALVDALTRGMIEHGPNFTEAHVRILIDEQMRLHLRTLAVTAGPPSGGR